MLDNIYVLNRKILYKELQPLFEELASVRYAVVKGEVLSQQIYGVPDRRRSSDIDILIDKKNVKFLEEQLHKLGFEQKLPEDNAEIRRNRVLCMAYSHQIPSFHKDKFGFHLNVDVNYDIFWGEYEGKRCSIDEFLSDTVDMEIYGVNVKTLTIEKALIQLMLHHYKEMNSLYHLSRYNNIRTYMFKDIYDLLICRAKILTSNNVFRLCEKYSIEDIGYYMIYYTKLVFDDIFLNPYVRNLEVAKNVELLESYGLCSKERKQWKLIFHDRLDCEMLPKIILSDMTASDLEKNDRSNNIFS